MIELNDDYRVKPPEPRPLLRPVTLPGVEAGDVLMEHIARIESLKIKLLRLPGLTDLDRNDLFNDLDILRGALLQSRRGIQVNPDAPPGVEPSPRRRAATAELKMEGIIGQSPRIQKLLRIISRIAPTDLTVLMEGETGAGKELFARLIHNNSGRTHFVAVNCGAFPSGLIESELFGHVKGAFTGATHDRKGKFEEANGGTIFLDEIGELEMPAQVKLLRVLQEGELQRVGSDAAVKTNVRVIAATNRDLAKMVEEGTFREDLYYRINLCPLFIPPLRERRDEIRILFEYFFQAEAASRGIREPVLDRGLQSFLYERYDFPGNIRELKNLAQFLANVSTNAPLGVEDLPERYQEALTTRGGHGEDDSPLVHAKDRAERQTLTAVLTRLGGRVQAVCTELDISRARLYQLLKKHDLKPADFRARGRRVANQRKE
ncbi:MAG TPA: sigma-54 dependent transcriptional regulator [Gammaproteobacteria bacterium]|nr:sigma-54 dependent transcriptional regulator [Gammaproteobacteria bacterium]